MAANERQINPKIKALLEDPPNEAFVAEFERVLKSYHTKSWKQRSLGNFTPTAYFLEPTRGCNLKCGFCYTATLPRNQFEYMEVDTVRALCEIIREVSPFVRIEFAQAGEPTLNPNFLEIVSTIREMVPNAQIGTYTNGTTLISGKMRFKDMLDAGLNVIFVDMYHPIEKFQKLAKDAAADHVFDFLDKENLSVHPFTYQNKPGMRCIYLAPNPENWRKGKKTSVTLSTFLNHLDWELAAEYGLKPVTNAPNRRCNQPSKYVTVDHKGEYVFCCTDFYGETAGLLGNVYGGVDEFLNFWLGEWMQATRNMLFHKNRKGHELCSKCSATFSRCDIPRHQEELLQHYFRDGSWHDLENLAAQANLQYQLF